MVPADAARVRLWAIVVRQGWYVKFDRPRFLSDDTLLDIVESLRVVMSGASQNATTEWSRI